MEPVTHLKSYTTMNEDEFELETVAEAAHPVLWTESEIRALEQVANALIAIGSPHGDRLLTKVYLWRATRQLEVVPL